MFLQAEQTEKKPTKMPRTVEGSDESEEIKDKKQQSHSHKKKSTNKRKLNDAGPSKKKKIVSVAENAKFSPKLNQRLRSQTKKKKLI